MKFSFHSIFVILLLAIGFLGCQSKEKFVTDQDGIWNIVNYTEKRSDNDVQVSDITKTDSLGQMVFVHGGSGTRYDYVGNKTDFTWEVSKKGDRLVVYYPAASFMDAAITGITDKTMSLKWHNEVSPGTVLIKYDYTMKLERP